MKQIMVFSSGICLFLWMRLSLNYYAGSIGKNERRWIIYEYLPFILAVVCALSYIPIYINEDMTIRQIFLQRAAGLLMLEIFMCFAVFYFTGDDLPGLGYVAVILFTAFFDALSYMICWYLDMEKADMINRKIAERCRMTNGK